MKPSSKSLPLILLVTSIAVLLTAMSVFRPSGDAASAARLMERRLEKRVQQMDRFAQEASGNPGEWLELEGLPEDMVVYRYFGDTLESWVNRFPVINDDINARVTAPRLVNPRLSLQSPLSEAGPEPGMVSLGYKWFLLKAYDNADMHIVVGLEISDLNVPVGRSGLNRSLGLRNNYSVHPLSSPEGVEVRLGGRPLMKVHCDSQISAMPENIWLLWLSLGFLLAAGMVWLSSSRTVRRAAVCLVVFTVAIAGFYLYGRGVEGVPLFSSALYADGQILYSLGAVFLVNLAVFFYALVAYMVRKDIFSRLGSKLSLLAGIAVPVPVMAGVLAYAFYAIRSITFNSGITLELYKLQLLTPYSLMIYLSFMLMLTSIPMMVQLMQPSFAHLLGRHVDINDTGAKLLASAVLAVFLAAVTSYFGFHKEQDRVEAWAHRLSVQRDISLELQLMRVESQIGRDPLIGAIAAVKDMDGVVLNRIREVYLPQLSQMYEVSVATGPDIDLHSISVGVPISDDSGFIYVVTGQGHYQYSAVFRYGSKEGLSSAVMLTVAPRVERGDGAYARLLNASSPGSVSLPSRFSYAKYDGRDLQYCNGNYSYPMHLDNDGYKFCYGGSNRHERHVTLHGSVHFACPVSDGEAIVISRPDVGWFRYLFVVLLLGVTFFLILSAFRLRKMIPVFRPDTYYKRRITVLVMGALTLTLATMMTISVVFVYARNERNVTTVMTERIVSIAEAVEERVRGASSIEDIGDKATLARIEHVGMDFGADITLYSPEGRVFFSTVPDLYEKMLLPFRMDGDAFHQVSMHHRLYHIQEEKVGRQVIYNLYAPLTGRDGGILAIVSSPFASGKFSLEEDAVQHSLVVAVLFIILLMVTMFLSSAVIDGFMRPLNMLGRKMSGADLDNLEHIEYGREDELSVLVTAYNRMVDDLQESSRQLAQAERDKAWSGMARQVAHEIKTPLTPMKLQIQRIIRLKQRNAPGWEEKMDDAAKVLLDHIDILTDTANEFSTFAKLYSEEHVRINLDDMLQEEISMFESREDVRFDYYGLADAVTTGPKPQLTRVFVNLMTNAVQALEGREDARIAVSLRNSTRSGFYDIVVEDNGPGVSDDNAGKLFTPNFTTKNGGSGLGLAISRSILDRCGGTISYQKSFALGGACFVVTYPKN